MLGDAASVVLVHCVPQPKEDATTARPKTLAQLRMQLKAEREAEVESRPAGSMSDAWSGPGPAAKSHLKELTRLMEGARTEAGTNFSQLLQKLDNIKQVRTRQYLRMCVLLHFCI